MRQETSESHRQVIREAVAYVERRLGRDLGLGALAKRGGMAPHYFHRRFREIVGEPPSQYIKRLRLERAAFRVRSTCRPIQELAREAGYSSHEGFSRAFRARFGLTPSEFRSSGGNLDSPMHVTWSLQCLPPRRVAFLRHVGPYDEIPRVVHRLGEWAKRVSLISPDFMISYLDAQDITEADKTRCEVALEIPEGSEGEGEVQHRDLAGGEFLVGRHDRPYEADLLRASYAYLIDEVVPSLGRELGVAGGFETYPGYGAHPFEAGSPSDSSHDLPRETRIHLSLAPLP